MTLIGITSAILSALALSLSGGGPVDQHAKSSPPFVTTGKASDCGDKVQDKTVLGIPKPLKLEHQELHQKLKSIIAEGGRIGQSAKAVAEVLGPHFVKEEKYALPVLGLLPALASGKITPDMRSAVPLTETLKAELPKMLQEHKEIVRRLRHLADVAKQEGKTEHVQFAEKLMLHAQTEEEVLYPTAILIGEYLKLKK